MANDDALRKLLDEGDEIVKRSKTVREVCREQSEEVRAVMEQCFRLVVEAHALVSSLTRGEAAEDEKAPSG